MMADGGEGREEERREGGGRRGRAKGMRQGEKAILHILDGEEESCTRVLDSWCKHLVSDEIV